MKWKRALFIMVLNTFLLMAVSLILELLAIKDKFSTVQETIQTALDTAIETAVASEEVFTASYQDKKIASYGSDDASMVENTTLLYADGEWHQVNSFALAMWYSKNKGHVLPTSSSEIGELLGINDSFENIYAFLYGGIGSEYDSDSLKWANRNKDTLKNLDGYGSNRTPTSRFKQFYDEVGNTVKSVGYVKQKTSDGTYKLVVMEYPTLVNMGLKLHELNETNSAYTSDNFTSTVHVGKASRGVSKTEYYFTPNSLGVTYIPTEVLKPVFLANVDSIARLRKLAGGNKDSNVNSTVEALNGANEHLNLNIYEDGVHQDHYVTDSHYMVTDGLVEYDLSTAEVKVDYFSIDFSNYGGNTAILASNLWGITADIPNQTLARRETLNRMLSDKFDTATNLQDAELRAKYEAVKDIRVVARVSCRIKLHICYDNPFLQWIIYKALDYDTDEHYDIKLYNPSNGEIVQDSNGVWYQYTTYYSTTR